MMDSHVISPEPHRTKMGESDGRDLVDLVDRACERGFDTGYVSFMELAQKGENHKVGRA